MGWNGFVYYGLKRLDFNKGWDVLGNLGVENNENESWVDMSWIFHVKGWSDNGLKCLWVELSMGWKVWLPQIAVSELNICIKYKQGSTKIGLGQNSWSLDFIRWITFIHNKVHSFIKGNNKKINGQIYNTLFYIFKTAKEFLCLLISDLFENVDTPKYSSKSEDKRI